MTTETTEPETETPVPTPASIAAELAYAGRVLATGGSTPPGWKLSEAAEKTLAYALRSA